MSSVSYSKRVFNESLRLREQYNKLSTPKIFTLLKASRSVERFAAADVLRIRGGYAINRRCLFLLNNSSNFRERETSAYILGNIQGIDNDVLKGNIVNLKHRAMNDGSSYVISSIVFSLYAIFEKMQLSYVSFYPLLCELSKSSSVVVRFAVARALIHSKIGIDISSLLEKLLADPAEKVRDWAGLAVNLSSCDTPAIRDALVSMLGDKRKDGRIEAITALAKRRDARVIPALEEELSQKNPLDDAILAVADLGDLRFVPILEQLLDRFDDSDGLIRSSLDKLKAIR